MLHSHKNVKMHMIDRIYENCHHRIIWNFIFPTFIVLSSVCLKQYKFFATQRSPRFCRKGLIEGMSCMHTRRGEVLVSIITYSLHPKSRYSPTDVFSKPTFFDVWIYISSMYPVSIRDETLLYREYWHFFRKVLYQNNCLMAVTGFHRPFNDVKTNRLSDRSCCFHKQHVQI